MSRNKSNHNCGQKWQNGQDRYSRTYYWYPHVKPPFCVKHVTESSSFQALSSSKKFFIKPPPSMTKLWRPTVQRLRRTHDPFRAVALSPRTLSASAQTRMLNSSFWHFSHQRCRIWLFRLYLLSTGMTDEITKGSIFGLAIGSGPKLSAPRGQYLRVIVTTGS